MKNWRESRGGSPAGANTLDSLPDVSLPLGPGELDEELGLPLCVVCQNVSSSSTTFSLGLLIDSIPRPIKRRH